MNKIYENIRKIATGKGDDYTTGCLLDYPYFKENYKMIAVDLSRKMNQMQILEQFKKLILQQTQIELEIQQYSLVKSLEDSGLLLKGVTE